MPTLKDVAKLACVDVSTVSRALNNNPCVHAETKARIMAAVAKLSYRPNLLAKGLRQGKRHTIGFVVPKLHLSVFSTIAQSVEETARKAGYATLIFCTDDNAATEKDGLMRLRSGLVDGIVLAGTGKNKTLIRDIAASGIAVTQIVRIVDEKQSSITVDYGKCGSDAVHFLYQKGCRHIGLITGPQTISPYRFRLEGYERAMKELGLEEIFAEAVGSTISMKYGYDAAGDMLRAHPELDAVIAATDSQGIGTLRALKESGRRVPADVRVISLTGHEIGSFLETSLTTLEMPAREIGIKAARMTLEKIEADAAETVPVQHISFDSRLIEREST